MSNKVITYKKELLDVIKSLGVVNRSLEIKNLNDKVSLKFKNVDKSVAVMIEAPDDYFKFGDDIHFDDFSEFYEILNSFNSPQISRDDNNLFITADKTKMKYRLTDPECISSTLSDKVVDALAKMTLDVGNSYSITSDEFKNLNKMISLVDGQLITFKCVEKNINVSVTSKNSSHVYETVWEGENETSEEFSLPVESKILKILPNENYKISFYSTGFISLEMIRKDDVKIKLFISESTNAQ